MAGIPFLSRILALAGIKVKNQTLAKEANITVSPSQSAAEIDVVLPTISGTLPVISQVVLASEKGQINGVATLDNTGKVPTAQLPAYAVSEVFVVPNQAARLALTAQVGDIAIQTDTDVTYILQSEPATEDGNWVVISSTSAVTAVNGQAGPGPVFVYADDVNAVPIDGHTPMTGALTITDAADTTKGGTIYLQEAIDNGVHTVGLKAPDNLTDLYTLTLPEGHGAVGQVLATYGGTGPDKGKLYWTNNTAADAVTSVNTITPVAGNVTLTAGNVGAVALSGDTMTGNLTLGTTGTLAGQTTQLRFMELAGQPDSSQYVGFKAPDTITTSVIWTLPDADGAANQSFVTNGSGILSWITPVQTVNGKSGSSVSLTTDDVTQGSTNRYFTDAYAQTAIYGSAGDLSANFALVSSASGKVSVSTISTTKLGYLTDVTSNIQAQIDSKQATITGAATTITSLNLTADLVLVSNASGKVAVSTISTTKLGYLTDVTSNIQAQIDGKQATITGAATTITSSDLTVDRAVISDGSGKIAVSATTSTEIGYLSGVTSSVQTQLNGKQATITGAATTITSSDLTVSRALVSDALGKVAVSSVTSTELDYLSGVTSAVQTQINSKVSKSGDSMTGALTMNAQNEIRFADADSSNYVGFKADTTITANLVWTLPTVDGTANQALITDGSGKLSWGNTLVGTLVHPNTESTFEYGAANPSMTGGANTAIGVAAGDAITTGQSNTLYGGYAGSNITKGNNNIGIGYAAINGLTGTGSDAQSNVGIGNGALGSVTLGSDNIGIGYTAGYNLNSSSSYNTVINSLGAASSSTLSGIVAIGKDSSGSGAVASANNQFVLGTANHKYHLPGVVETVLVLGPTGTLPGETGEIRFSERATNGSNYIALRAPDSIDSNITWTLPAVNGSAGYTLTNNGSGGLSWSETVDAAARLRLDALENSRGVYSGNLQSDDVMDISSLVDGPTALEYPIVQIYKNVAGVYEHINIEFSFDSSTKEITFGEVVDGPISVVIHVLALTTPYTSLTI
jgi:hypothetical protein